MPYDVQSSETTAPTGHDVIRVRGARENNLRSVDLDLPKRKLIVFTGVSGSGKSSLVFETIAAESRRLINETYSAFLQSFMPTPSRPDVDSLENLSAAIVVDQERMGANARSTVGTATDTYAMLRVIFSRLGKPHAGASNVFSFNDPQGMCPACEGLGRRSTVDVDRLVDRDLSLEEGAIDFPNFQVGSWFWRLFTSSGFLDPKKKLRDFTEAEWRSFLEAPPTKFEHAGSSSTYEGLLVKLRRLYLSKEPASLQPHLRAAVERIAAFGECEACDGARLGPLPLSSKIAGRHIGECAAMQIDRLLAFIREIDAPEVAPIVRGLSDALSDLCSIGLGYLSLDRPSATLSGGEAQRVKMVRHVGSSLTDLTYVFDEPSVGLHPHDVQRIAKLLERLRDKGNTVLVVEHEPELICIADHVVDMGPGAGAAGGTIVYRGDVDGLRASGTVTGVHLERLAPIKSSSRVPTGELRIEHASLHNLRDVSVALPLGVLTAVTGVAGSGKSSLVRGSLPRSANATFLDQAPIRGSRRSNPATYTGALDPIRKAFAKANGVNASLFSANSEGACARCEGVGLLYTDLAFMPGVVSVCEACEGKRFTPEVLGYTLRGKNIGEVFDMTVDDANRFFSEKGVRPILESLAAVGLGYITLGQPLDTLSGGERQRLKLAIHMSSDARIYVLDEPTSGLHVKDVAALLALLDRLVDGGRTVIVIEHNLDVVAHADWVIDLGPGAGHEGGRVVFEGPPRALVECEASLTGRYLRQRHDRTARDRS
jgi:excinuclease UvrABC ATPase subunit